MPLIELHSTDLSDLSAADLLSAYNATDCCATIELAEVLFAQLSAPQRLVYEFTRHLAAPALEMEQRGILVDKHFLSEAINNYSALALRYEAILLRLSEAVWDRPLNENSHVQLKEFFYRVLNIPEIFSNKKGVRSVSVDQNALEKLQDYLFARPFAKLILALRDAKKKLAALRSGVDPDGRMRCSFNVTGTDTGRWSSSKNPFGGGMNFQNLTESLRRIFRADPGYKIAYIDLEQAESRAVAALVYSCCGDTSYWDACESGDLHTAVCKMTWPNLPWPNTPAGDKALAESPFYRHFSYRDMAKRGGHGSNYLGQPATMARHLHVAKPTMVAFQESYFSAFHGIPKWHHWTIQQLESTGGLTTPLGRYRRFLGRLTEPSTHRAAVAHCPQSMVGDILNIALWKVWQLSLQLRTRHNAPIQLLGQVHDAIVVQYVAARESELLPRILAEMAVPVPVRDRTLLIPCEAAIGWNWAKVDPKCRNFADGNPHGLTKYRGSADERTAPAEKQVLDFCL